MLSVWNAGRSKMLAIFIATSAISIILLTLFASTSEAETVTGTVGKPGTVGTAYNLVDADYSDQYTDDGLIYWPRTLAYRAGSGTSYFNRPQTVSVTYQVFSFARGETRLVGSRKASVNLGTTGRYGYTPSAYMFVGNNDLYGIGYRVVTYVAWKDTNTNTLIAARTFNQNDASDYRCVDYNNNLTSGYCRMESFTNGDAYVRIDGNGGYPG